MTVAIFKLLIIGTCSSPAVSRDNVVTDEKQRQCSQVVDTVFNLLTNRLTARQIMTRQAREEQQ